MVTNWGFTHLVQRNKQYLVTVLFSTLNFLFFLPFPFSDAPIFGFADDYVFMIRGLLDLYEASLDEQWLQWAVALQAKLDELFWDSAGAGYFMATPDDPSILVRMKEG